MSLLDLYPNAQAIAVVVAIDRQERGKGDLSAIQEVERDFGLAVLSVLSLEDIVAYLSRQAGYERELSLIEAYRAKYGIR